MDWRTVTTISLEKKLVWIPATFLDQTKHAMQWRRHDLIIMYAGAMYVGTGSEGKPHGRKPDRKATVCQWLKTLIQIGVFKEEKQTNTQIHTHTKANFLTDQNSSLIWLFDSKIYSESKKSPD